MLPSPTVVSDVQATPTESPLANLGSDPVSKKNNVGMLLVGVVVLLIAVFARPWKKKQQPNDSK
jgi:hypothetical protein